MGSTSRRNFLAGLGATPFALTMGGEASPSSPAGARQAPDVPRGRQIGTAVRPDQLLSATPLRTAIQRQDILVPEYHGQWSAVEWRRGDPWYGNYDEIVSFAWEHGQVVRGHSLLWEQMTPDWARAEILEERRWRTVERHFASLLPRYRDRIGEWIVVNEMIDTEHGSRSIRRTTCQQAFGNSYVERALETARSLDPTASLMINEYGLYFDNPIDEARRRALLSLVETLKKRNVPLDVVGIQGHLEMSKGRVAQERLSRFMADLAATGVGLAVTELDVLEADRSRSVVQRDLAVSDTLRAFLDVVHDQPAVRSIVTWGLSDRHSWLQERDGATMAASEAARVDGTRLNRGLPYDADMRPKLALASLREVSRPTVARA